MAEFTGLDKITGRTITFDVYIGETVQFGALQVTPRVCYTAGEEVEPRTDSYVEVDENHPRPHHPPHLLRLDVRRKPGPQRRRTRRL